MSVLHAWSKFIPKDPEAIRRHGLAQCTWVLQPWKDKGVEDRQLPRLFEEGKRRFPFLRDILDFAANGQPDQDIIVLTNADIGLVDECCWRIALALQVNDAGYTNRKDAHQRIAKIPTSDEIKTWRNYEGTDTFFFRVKWWKMHRTIMPDMIIAREAWDACLRVLIEMTNHNKPLSITDVTWHERHGGDGYWEDPQNRYTIPGQIHNLHLAKAFMKRNGLNPATFGIR